MKFDTYFRLTSYALIGSAFAALALTGEVDGLALLLYSLAFIGAFVADARGVSRWRPQEWMWRVLVALYVPFLIGDALFLSNRVLALVHLSLFASAVKLFQKKENRDWVFLYLIAFFQMLLAAGLTFNAVFVAALIAFIFFFISTLAAFEIRRTQLEVTELRPRKEEIPEEVITKLKTREKRAEVRHPARRVRYLMGASLAQVIIISALTLPLFFMIPRFNSAGVGKGFGDGEMITGFSDRVELGQVASIKESSRVVLRVQLSRKPPHYLRWRGIALDYYNGKAWSLAPTSFRNRYTNSNQERRSAGGNIESDSDFERSFNLQPMPFDQPPREDFLEQRIILEPLSTKTIFAAHNARMIRGRVANIRRDNFTGALEAEGLRGRFQYTASSNISVPTEDELRADNSGDYPDDITRLYLQKPDSSLPKPDGNRDLVTFDPRIRKLALEVTHNARTNYDKALAIQNYLRTEFNYSLNLKMGSTDPLAEFLFETQEGHCEYFATAMVMMLRSIGIPARIVNGFQMGEYNQLNDYYTVRESDAHSWVEAYFPHTEKQDGLRLTQTRLGTWVEFDPTPSAGINDYSKGGLRATLRKYMDAMEVFWLDYVVTLDKDEQASMIVEFQHRLLDYKSTILAYYKTAKKWLQQQLNSLTNKQTWTAGSIFRLIVAAMLILLLGLSTYVATAYRKHKKRNLQTGYNVWWYRLFIAPFLRWFNRRKHDHQATAVLFYEQMLAVAARGGMVKAPEQTPMEFATSASYAQIREITILYNRVRFGKSALNDEETNRVTELLAELKKAIRQRQI